MFENGLKKGHGVWRNADNSQTYQGDFSCDLKEGQGEFPWASGDYYKGAYQSDLKHGYGEMYWADGSLYRG